MAEVHPKIRELCGLIAAVVRSGALWGEDKAMKRDDDFSLNAVVAAVAGLLKMALGRDPSDAEMAAVLGE